MDAGKLSGSLEAALWIAVIPRHHLYVERQVFWLVPSIRLPAMRQWHIVWTDGITWFFTGSRLSIPWYHRVLTATGIAPDSHRIPF